MANVIDLDAVRLSKGTHRSPEEGMSVMELVAYLDQDQWRSSVSPVITDFLLRWNDTLDGETRQKLKPYARRVINTRGLPALEERRAFLALDWLIRTHTVAWLRQIALTEAKLAKHAERLANLAPQTSQEALLEGEAAWTAARTAVRNMARTVERAAPSLAIRNVTCVPDSDPVSDAASDAVSAARACSQTYNQIKMAAMVTIAR